MTHLKLASYVLLIAAAGLTGCSTSSNHGANNGHHRVNYVSHPDYFATRRTLTGSHIPQPVNRPTASQLSSHVPLESFARDRPSLVSGEQVVGAGGESLYRLKEPSSGAGPAGSVPLPSGDRYDKHQPTNE